jgi:hypothetical protein
MAKIDLRRDLSVEHFSKFVELWSLIQTVHLCEDIGDDVVRRLMPNGEYSAESVYEVQFLGSVASAMNKYIWKVWALPKVKFFA